MVCQVLPDDVPEAGEVDGGPGRYRPTAQPYFIGSTGPVSVAFDKGAPGDNRGTGLKHPHMPLSEHSGRCADEARCVQACAH